MDENRIQAYVALIIELLHCPSGEEAQILEKNAELVDAGLVETMVQVAEMMAENGDVNADWLRSAAIQLAKILNNSSSTDTGEEYRNLLIQVLQATADSNGDAGVIYPLLQANLDKLDMGFAVALKTLAIYLTDVEPETAQRIAIDIYNFSNLIREFPLGNQANNLEIAIAGYEVVETVFTRDRFPEQWAMTQKSLFNAQKRRIILG